MTLRARISFVAIWIVSLLLVAMLVHAQAPNPAPIVPLETPVIVSGAELGFRVIGRRGTTPVGTFVVRSGATGQWVEPELSRETVQRRIGK